MHYKLANLTLVKDNSAIEFIGEITDIEANEFFDTYKYLRLYKQAKKLSEYAVNSGISLSNFLKDISIGRYRFETEREKLVDKANRLIYNYCSNIVTLIHIYGEYLKKISNDKVSDYHSFTKKLYFNKFEYRFFYKLRNYCVHIDFPFTQYIENESQIKILCDTKHLLEYNGWDIAKADIKTMDEIDIVKYITPMNVIIYELYLQFLYFIKENLTKTLDVAENLFNKYNPTLPFAIFSVSNNLNDKIEKKTIDLTQEAIKMNMTYVDVELIKESIMELGRHPRVNLL